MKEAESFALSWDDNTFQNRELDKVQDYRPSKKDKYIEEQLYEEKLKMELEEDQGKPRLMSIRSMKGIEVPEESQKEIGVQIS